jgi:hypothetical protein
MKSKAAALERTLSAAKRSLDNIEARLENTATKEDFAEIRATFRKRISDLKVWTVTSACAIFATMLAAVSVIYYDAVSSGQTSQATTPQVIIIQPLPAPQPTK